MTKVETKPPEPAASSLSPFRHRAFAVLWTATVVANIGTWMQNAAAGWLMTSLDPDPLMVSLVQVATSLPMFLFALAGGALADITAVLTILGGETVHGDAEFKDLSPPLPAAMPDWSPVNRFGGYQARGRAADHQAFATMPCGCGSACAVHGHAHARPTTAELPVSDATAFWGALGCSCWAF